MATIGRMLFSLVMKMVCLCGFLWQVSTVANTFFGYKTTSKVVQDTRDRIVAREIPNLLLCISYTDVLDLGSLNRDHKLNFNRSKNFNDVTRMQANLTLQQIFDYVPDINETIKSCGFRSKNGLLMLNATGTECNDKFEVYRFYVQSYMCYGFKYRGEVNFTSKQIANSLSQANLLYGVTLGPKFAGADMVMVCVYYGKYPTTSRQYSVLVNRLADFQSLEARNNLYVFGFSANRVELMQAPYDTMCSTDLSGNTGDICNRRCLEPIEKQLDRVYFTRFIRKGSPMKHINFYDLDNLEKRTFIKEHLYACNKKCIFRPCVYNYTITYYDMAMKIPKSRQDFSVATRIAKAPGLSVKFEAKLPLMEFVIYVCSCIGIWFGLSAISLNPFDSRAQRKMRWPFDLFRFLVRKRWERKVLKPAL